MKKCTKHLLILLACVALSGCAMASVIYIDFCTEGNTDLPSTYAAAADAAGVWNGVDGSIGVTPSLLDIAGEQTSVDLRVTATISNQIQNGPDSQTLNLLLQDCLYTSQGYAWNVTLSGLENGAYDVYVYAPGHPFIGALDYALNGVTHSGIWGSRDANLDEGTDYEISRINVSGGSLSIAAASSDGIFRGLAGLQVVSVPEPASAIMLLIGGSIIASFRNLRKNYGI